MRYLKQFATVLLLVGCSISWAESGTSETLLKGKQVTREALIDALKLDASAVEASDADGQDPMPKVKTRGFKLDSVETKPAQSRKASLLITFAVGSAKLTKESLGLLETMAAAMKSKALAGSKFVIEGHADPRGDEAYNLSLSQQRAESVQSFLEQHGIARENLSAVGKGSSELLNSMQPEAAENRRVTFVNLVP